MTGYEETAQSQDGYGQADELEAGACLARWNAEGAAGRLNVLPHFYNTVRKRDYQLGGVNGKSVRALYGSTLNLSASQIDRQAE